MRTEAERVLRAAAVLHGVEVTIYQVGEARSAPCDPTLQATVRAAAATLPGVTRILDHSPMGGSEDATLMMAAVQANGGAATYLLVGTPLPAGHHHPAFDVDEAALPIGVDLALAIVDRLLATP